MLRRSRLNQPELGERVIWSASEHLIVERPLSPPSRRRLPLRITSIVIVLGCVAAITYLVVKPPASLLPYSGAAPTPAAWFHHYGYAFDSQNRLKLLSLSEHGRVAVLRIAPASGGEQTVTLRERSGEWQLRGSS